MACGLPTIASNIGGLKQLIKNKITGILVDEARPEKIAEAIIKLINDKEYYFNIKRDAREYIINKHSHTESSKKYLIEFNKFLKGFLL